MNNMLSDKIKTKALDLGFSACGICRAEALTQEAVFVEQWLSCHANAEMHYLENNKEKRYDPRLLIEGTQSIVTVLLNYFPKTIMEHEDNYRIAKYAYGKDYHYIIKDKLRQLLSFIEKETDCHYPEARAFTDSAPVLDRAWAVKAGLGFIGKNTNLIVPKGGSYYFIGHLMLPIILETDNTVMTNRCGNCDKCLKACPTHAIESPFHLNASKCISYLTIEHKGDLPDINRNVFNDYILGCDICQDVCPYNKFAVPTDEPLLQPHENLLKMRKKDWHDLDNDGFNAIFKNSAAERAGFKGLKRNIDFLKNE